MSRRSHACAGVFLAGLTACTGIATVTDPLRHAGAPHASPLSPGISLDHPVALETHEGLLWVLTDTRALVSVTPGQERVVRHLAQDDVLGLHRTPDARLWALTRDKETDDLRLWGHEAMTWTLEAEWMGMGASPLALTSSNARPVVISPAAAFVLEDGDLRGVELSDRVGSPGYYALAAATRNGTAYVYEPTVGESGYLNAVDLESGDVRSVVCPSSLRLSIVGPGGERRPCTGVTGVVADPASADCALVSFANQASGFLWRVCSEHAEVVTGPWEDLVFVDDPARALSVFGELRRPAGEGDSAEPRGGEESSDGLMDLCTIDPDACPKGEPSLGPIPLVGLAPAGEGVWIATPDALIAWRPGVVSSIALRSGNAKTKAPVKETRSVTTLGGDNRTLVAAEASGPNDPRNKPPPVACYRATNGDALCFDEDRYVRRSELALVEGKALIGPVGDGSYAAFIDGGERVTLFFGAERALLLRKVGERRVGAWLAPLGADETRSLLEAEKDK